MTENPEIQYFAEEGIVSEEKPMETVVNSLLKHQSRTKSLQKDLKTYDALYKDIKDVLIEFDVSILDCKKYNEAKIHRKYEIIIEDLKVEINRLREKVRCLQGMRSDGKGSVDELIDELVRYKEENEKLAADVQNYRELKFEENKVFETEMKEVNDRGISEIQVRSVLVNEGSSYFGNKQEINLKLIVTSYLKQERLARKVNEEPRSKFEEFLKKNINNLDNWNMMVFLGEIGKWVAESKNKYNVLDIIQPGKLPFLDESLIKRLPKLENANVSPKNNNQGYFTSRGSNIAKKRECYKSRHNFSACGGVNRMQEKFPLK